MSTDFQFTPADFCPVKDRALLARLARMTSRLITHGPVTPMVPSSIYQLLPCTIFLDPQIAKPIECMELTGY
jgi:hypothetical protein